MTERLRQGIAPAYLFLCLLLGGSAQGIWQNMMLQLLGLLIIAWACWIGVVGPIERQARDLVVLGAVGIAVVLLQLVPLPAPVWSHLPGHHLVLDEFRILGMQPDPEPLSLTPHRGMDSLLGLIPPAAIFTAIIALKAYRPSWLAAALVLGAIAGVLLGALQVSSSGNIADSHWYPYAQSSFGLATGFFANANHMANLLACTLPFLAALLLSARSGASQRRSGVIVGVAAAALLVVVGVALNHSLAIYALTPPVLAASALLLLPQRGPWRPLWSGATAILVIAAVAGLASTSVRSGDFAGGTSSSVQSREEMLRTSARAMHDFLPWGSGLGSFQSVYHLYEDPTQVTATYVPHAHDDYAELALELGVPGILLVLTFLAWWARAAWTVWRRGEFGPLPRAASIASGVILIHSLVDFPLRTAAISSLFAMCLALMIERRGPAVRVTGDLRPTRHLVFR